MIRMHSPLRHLRNLPSVADTVYGIWQFVACTTGDIAIATAGQPAWMPEQPVVRISPERLGSPRKMAARNVLLNVWRTY